MVESTALTRRTVLALPLALAACRWGDEVITLAGQTMGTSWSVVAVDRKGGLRRAEMARAIDGALAAVNAEMSNWDAGSEISRFNSAAAGTPMQLSRGLGEVIAASGDVHAASGGAFDATLGPVVDLWGFGARATMGDAPSDAALADAMAVAGQSRVLRREGDALAKTADGAEVIVSGIGKGHGVDRVAGALASLGAEHFMVEIGGDLYTMGRNPDGAPWRIGIEKPVRGDRATQRVVGVSGMGLATSGDYRNYFEAGGRRYTHVLDARTGRPITHRTASATVLAENAMMADAWSTAMLAMGREEGMGVAETHDLPVLFIDRDARGSETDFVATASPAFTRLVG
jgi:thiamine biosynthesis lipoprotein